MERSRNFNVLPWLKTNLLINDTTDVVLKECMDEIMDSFGGIKEFLFLITNQCRNFNTKLQSIHKIVKKQVIKNQNENKSSTNHNNDNINQNQSAAVFLSLPNECISSMCNFLSKYDLKSFKLSSRQIAIVCLEEMKKISIGIFNANHLLNNNNANYEYINNLYNLKIRNMLTWNRYPSYTKYHTMCDKWHKTYNVPIENQLAFTVKHKMKLKDLTSLRMQPIERKKNDNQFLLCDTRKMVILNENQVRKYNIENESYENIEKYQLLILEYFDVSQQKTNIAQFMLCESAQVLRNIIFEYIENKFILLDGMDNNWYNCLKYNLTQMSNDDDCHKLCIYQHINYQHMALITADTHAVIEPRSYSPLLFTFQLNYNHPWFTKTHSFDKIQLRCKEEMDIFHVKATVFCSDTTFITVCFEGNESVLKSVIKMYYEIYLNNSKMKNMKVDLDCVLQRVCRNNFKIKMNKSSKSEVLRHKISKKLFDGIIEAKYIEIFDRRKNKIPWKSKLSRNNYIYYSVVLYNTESFK